MLKTIARSAAGALLGSSVLLAHPMGVAGLAETSTDCPSDTDGVISTEELPEGTSAIECDLVGTMLLGEGAGAAIPEPGQSVSYTELMMPGATGSDFSITVSEDGEISYDEESAEGGEFLDPQQPTSCNVTVYKLLPKQWYQTMDWEINRSSIPADDLVADSAVDSIKDAIKNITGSVNSCGMADLVDAQQSYQGTTSRHANISVAVNDDGELEGRCDSTPNGFSTVSFGFGPEDVLASTCSWAYVHAGPNSIYAADVEIQNRYVDLWTTVPQSAGCDDEYDLEGVMTHEFGHAYGLNDVSSASLQTMAEAAEGVCSIGMRTLGRGDVLGLRQRY